MNSKADQFNFNSPERLELLADFIGVVTRYQVLMRVLAFYRAITWKDPLIQAILERFGESDKGSHWHCSEQCLRAIVDALETKLATYTLSAQLRKLAKGSKEQCLK